MHLLLAVLLGMVIGLSLGAIGGGGSILTVPILVYVMGQDAHAATVTSLAVVGTIALVGAIPHWRAGRISMRTALPFGLAGIGGALAGAWANHLLPGWLILGLFGILMVLVAVRMFLDKGARTDAGRRLAASPMRWARTLGAGLLVGLITGFFGVGGGFLIVPALVLLLALPMRQAVGTSLVIIAINSAAGLFAHARFGGLDLGISGWFVVGGAAGALLGALTVGRVDERRLQRGFAVFVAVIGAWLVIRNLIPLPLG